MRSVLPLLMVLLFGAFGRAPAGITVGEALELNENGAIFVDVRTPEEFAEGHIPSAVLAPLSELRSGADLIPAERNASLILYCTIGVRSAEAEKILKKRGYTHVYNLKGGIEAWKRSGHGVVP